MFRVLFITTLLIFTINASNDAQKRYIVKKTEPIVQSLTEKYNIKLKTSTYFYGLFPTFSSAGGEIAMVKDQDSNYYAIVKYSNLPLKNFESRHSLCFNLVNGEKLLLHPFSEAVGKTESGIASISFLVFNEHFKNYFTTMTTSASYSNEVYYCVYNINQVELQNLSSNKVNSITLVFESGDAISEGKLNNDGKPFLEYKTSLFARFIKGTAEAILKY